MNYGELKTLIAALSHRSDITIYDDLTELVEAEIGRHLRTADNEYTEEVTTTNQAYALSGLTKTFQALRSIYAAVGSERRPLRYYDKEQLDELTTGVSSSPWGYTIQSGSLEVRPVNGNQTLTLTYFYKPTSLVGSDSNTNFVLTTFPQLYRTGLLAEIAALENDDVKEQKYREQFANTIQDINDAAEDARYSGGSLAGMNEGLR